MPVVQRDFLAVRRCYAPSRPERRLALALALEGVDYGPAVVHGVALPV
ncbi:hypothetical protein OG302_25075 [Streptomyces sp. NBC_01283]|nr:hypothetical protein OG302_25075 [Streptomyces sp. NBC_01283]